MAGNGLELAVAYVSIVPEVSKIAPGVRKALGDTGRYGDAAGKTLGSKMASGASSALKKGLKVAGLASLGASVGGAISAGLYKGLGRLTAIEQAQAKLKGLGHSAQSVSTIMDNALASVKGTAFGLEEAASVAASSVAAGIRPGKELEKTLKLVADASTIAGRDMGSMGTIFNKVIAQGKVQGDELMQLSEAGIPALALLSKQMGKTTTEVSGMIKKGQIDAKTFMDAIGKGMPGAALAAGQTTQGAFKNMGAAAGRLGATLAGPFYHQARDAFSGMTELLDSMDATAQPVMKRFEGYIRGTMVPALRSMAPEAKTAFAALGESLSSVVSAGQLDQAKNSAVTVLTGMRDAAIALAPPLLRLVTVAAQVGAAISVDTWKIFADVLNGTAEVAEHVVAPITSVVAKLTGAAPGLMQTVTVFTLLRKAMAMDSAIGSVEKLGGRLVTLSGYAGKASGVVGALGAKVSGLTGAFTGFGGLAVGAVVTGVTMLASTVNSANSSFDSASKGMRAANIELEKVRNNVMLTKGEMSTEQVDAVTASLNKTIDATKELSETSKFGTQLSHLFGAYNGDGLDRQIAKIDTAKASMESWQFVQDRLGMSQKEITQAIAQGGDAYNSLVSKVGGLGEQGKAAAADIQYLRSKVTEMQAAAQNATPLQQFTSAMKLLGDASADTSAKLNAYSQTVALLAGRDLSAEQSTAKLNAEVEQNKQAFEQAAEAAAQAGGVMVTASGQIDTTTAAGRELFSSAQKMSEALYGQITAMQQKGSTEKDMIAQAQATRDTFIMNAQAAGLNAEQANKLADSYIGIPKQVVTVITNPGMAAASAEIAKYKGKLDAVPNEKAVTVKTLSEDAEKQLEDVGFKTQKLKDGKVKITADDKQLQGVLENAKKGVFQFAGLADKKTPRLKVDNSQAMKGINQVKQGIDNLSDKTVTITTKHKDVKGHFLGGLLGFSTGGFLPTTGPGTERRDGFLGVDASGSPIALVDAGEHVTRRSMSEKYHRELTEINNGTFPKLPGYATGGTVGKKPLGMVSSIKDTASRFDLTGFATGTYGMPTINGDKYVYGGRGWGDNLAMPIALARRAAGLAPFGEVPSVEQLPAYLQTLGARPGSWSKGKLAINFTLDGAKGSVVEAILPDGTIATMVPGKGGVLGGHVYGGLNQSYVMPASNPLAILAGVQNLPEQLLDDKGNLLEGDELKKAIQDAGGASALPGLFKSSGTTVGSSGTITGAIKDVISAGVTGQVADVLSVFGIEDRMPPLVNAVLQLAGLAKNQMGGSLSAGNSGAVDQMTGRTYEPSREEIAASMVATTPRSVAGAGAGQWRTTALAALEWLGMSTAMVDNVLAEIQKRSKGNTNYSAPAPLTEEEKEQQEDFADNRADYADSMRVYESKLAEWEKNGGKDKNGKPVAKPRKPKAPGEPKEKEFKDATVHGLMGLTPQEFFSNVDSELPRQIYHPLANIVAGLKIMDSDNASLEMLWGQMKHYEQGGKVKPNPKLKAMLKKAGVDVSGDDQIITAKTGEMIMSKTAAAGNEAVLDQMNQGVPLDERGLRAAPANMALSVYDSVAPQTAAQIASGVVTAGGKIASGALREGGKALGAGVSTGGNMVGSALGAIPVVGAPIGAVVSGASGIAGSAIDIGSGLAADTVDMFTPMAADLAGEGASQVAMAGSRMMHAGVDTLNGGAPTLQEMLSDHLPEMGAALSAVSSALPQQIGGGAFTQQLTAPGRGGNTYNFYGVMQDMKAKFNEVSMADRMGIGAVMV